MNRTRIAVVGVGALGRWHAQKLANIPSADLVAVVDRDSAAAERVARENDTRACSDYHELLDQLDAVSIVVPTTAHLAVAREFLERRIPVFVEKPLAATCDEARELAGIAEQHNCLLQVGHIERFNPALVAALDHIVDPRYIQAERVSPYTFRSIDVGVVHDLMIHDIDLVLSLVGSPLVDVEAFGATVAGGHEDTVQARLKFASGCIADLAASRVSPTARRTMQVWSPESSVTIDFASRNVTCYSRSDLLRHGPTLPERAAQPDADIESLKQDVFGRFITVESPSVSEADALNVELLSFVNSVRDNQPAAVTAKDGVAAMEAAERILSAVARHQWDGHADGRVGSSANPPRRRAG